MTVGTPAGACAPRRDRDHADRVRDRAPIRSALGLSRASPGRAATRPALLVRTTSLAQSGWSCSGRSCPSVDAIAVLREPDNQRCRDRSRRDMQAAARAFGIEASSPDCATPARSMRRSHSLAAPLDGGLIVAGRLVRLVRRNRIVALAARAQAAGDLYDRVFVAAGGLMSATGRAWPTSIGVPAATSTASSRARSPPTCRLQPPTKFELVDQPQDRQGARPHRAADAARPRRRGDRITMLFAAMSR